MFPVGLEVVLRTVQNRFGIIFSMKVTPLPFVFLVKSRLEVVVLLKFCFKNEYSSTSNTLLYNYNPTLARFKFIVLV